MTLQHGAKERAEALAAFIGDGRAEEIPKVAP